MAWRFNNRETPRLFRDTLLKLIRQNRKLIRCPFSALSIGMETEFVRSRQIAEREVYRLDQVLLHEHACAALAGRFRLPTNVQSQALKHDRTRREEPHRQMKSFVADAHRQHSDRDRYFGGIDQCGKRRSRIDPRLLMCVFPHSFSNAPFLEPLMSVLSK